MTTEEREGLQAGSLADRIDWGPDGLVPAVVQDATSHEVLMVGFANREALLRTIETGQAWFWSRSRRQLWRKGETSGHVLHVERVLADCDLDTLLYLAHPVGPTCHTGARSCFFHEVSRRVDAQEVAPVDGSETARPAAPPAPTAEIVEEVFAVILHRQATRPEGSYVAKLLASGVDRIGKKIGEEAAEVIIAAKNARPDEIAWEVADLWFHTLVLLAERGLAPSDVWRELARRRR
ncbi:MAG TPA: bifunctional phosphoribosyl-AMP cyclohydrolase/phosphoribosyl-ATP diphosphatase HisIE [Chloroflexota bacterium]